MSLRAFGQESKSAREEKEEGEGVMKGREAFLFAAILLLLSVNYARAGTWETLQVPGATSNSVAAGVDGGNIVGWYTDTSWNAHGFLYDGSSSKFLNAFSSPWTQALGISGNNIVGACGLGGFLYNGTNYQILNIPGSPYYGKSATDIDGSNIVGVYSDDSGQQHGFLFNGSSYSTIDPPGSTTTYINGISGNNIVGQYSYSGGVSGFVYNISSGTTTDLSSLGFITIYCIDGDNIIGRAWGPHNVLYNMKTQATTIIDMPGVLDSEPYGISGNKIVGRYLDASYVNHAFVYTIPEPASSLLIGIGAAFLSLRRRCRKP
jgi:hypothetical protein